MISNDVSSVLREFYSRINGRQIHWILTGSTSLAIQGINVEIKNE